MPIKEHSSLVDSRIDWITAPRLRNPGTRIKLIIPNPKIGIAYFQRRNRRASRQLAAKPGVRETATLFMETEMLTSTCDGITISHTAVKKNRLVPRASLS
jgi:hypothetical protein